MFKKIIIFITLTLFAALSIAAQSTPGDVQDLVGSRASSGESGLKSRGYRFIKTQKSDDRSFSNWWRASGRVCLSVVTIDGRYDSIVQVTELDCNQSYNGGNSGGNDNGQTSTPPSWAQGTFYGDGGISLTIDNRGGVSVVNGGQSYSGRYYQNKIFLNNDESTVSRNGNGIRTYNRNTGQYTNYSRTGGNNGGWGNNNGGQTSTPPSWAQGTFYSNTGITLTIDRSGAISVVNGGQSYSGRYYQNRIFLNNDESTVSRSGNGISTYNRNTRETTYYTRNYSGGGNNGGAVNVSDLIGSKASSGESDLRNRGFRNTRGYKSSGRSFTIWFNSNANQCIRVTTEDGRYSDIIATTDYSCR